MSRGYFIVIGLVLSTAVLWIASVFMAVLAYPEKNAVWRMGLIFGGLGILSCTMSVILHLWLEYHPETEQKQPFITVKN